MMSMVGVSEVSTDESLVVQAALDYIEGWFDGDAARMERALHPELAKRALRRDDAGERLETLTARQMIDATEQGVGKRVGAEERRVEVTVDHLFDGIASATVVSVPYVDYLQLARTEDGWKIVNVLWQRR
jgi:CRP-like cAMP-binding protein